MVTITFTRPLFSVLALQKIGERIVVFTKEDVCLFYSRRGLRKEQRKQCILRVRIIFSSGQANNAN